MAYAIRELHPDLGIEISGCDLSAPLCIGCTRTTTARGGPLLLGGLFLGLVGGFRNTRGSVLGFRLAPPRLHCLGMAHGCLRSGL